MRSIRNLLLGFVLMGCLNTAASGDDFRIETKVYSNKAKAPVSENITLFRGGVVYDYLSNPDRVSVFDKAHGRFILLDPARKLKTEIRTEDVMKLAEQFQSLAASSPNAFLKFAADPAFDVKFSEDGELTLSSPQINYRLQTEPATSPEASHQYREFSDWYARLNAMLNPGSTPPFPRLAVNEALAERGLVPTKVHLSIPAQATLARQTTMQSEHHVSWRLLQRDIQKIEETGRQLAAFKLVEFDEFQADKADKVSKR